MTNIVTLDWARRAHLAGIPVLPRLLSRITRVLFSCEIPYTAEIHPSVVFAHKGLGVVIGHDVVIGPRTKILQHVTIGGRSGVRASPRIGSDVLIGAGAVVLGGIVVGDGATVGAQSVVLEDVENGQVVVGVPARPVSGAGEIPLAQRRRSDSDL